MTQNEFLEYMEKYDTHDYGVCPKPIKAEDAMTILIDHILGVNWYVVMPLSQEQVYTQAIFEIVKKIPQKNEEKKFFKNFI